MKSIQKLGLSKHTTVLKKKKKIHNCIVFMRKQKNQKLKQTDAVTNPLKRATGQPKRRC